MRWCGTLPSPQGAAGPIVPSRAGLGERSTDAFAGSAGGWRARALAPERALTGRVRDLAQAVQRPREDA